MRKQSGPGVKTPGPPALREFSFCSCRPLSTSPLRCRGLSVYAARQVERTVAIWHTASRRLVSPSSNERTASFTRTSVYSILSRSSHSRGVRTLGSALRIGGLSVERLHHGVAVIANPKVNLGLRPRTSRGIPRGQTLEHDQRCRASLSPTPQAALPDK